MSSTPIDVTVPIPDTAWTDNGASVSFRQGSVGTLPIIPAGVGGAPLAPVGQRPDPRDGRLAVDEHRLPARHRRGQLAAGHGDRGRVRDRRRPGRRDRRSPAPKPKPAITLRSASLRGAKVKLSLQCTAAPCAGTVRAGTRKFLYTLEPGKRKAITLTLRSKPKKVTLRVSLSGGKAISKVLKAPKKKSRQGLGRPRPSASSRSSGTRSRTCTCSAWRPSARPT